MWRSVITWFLTLQTPKPNPISSSFNERRNWFERLSSDVPHKLLSNTKPTALTWCFRFYDSYTSHTHTATVTVSVSSNRNASSDDLFISLLVLLPLPFRSYDALPRERVCVYVTYGFWLRTWNHSGNRSQLRTSLFHSIHSPPGCWSVRFAYVPIVQIVLRDFKRRLNLRREFLPQKKNQKSSEFWTFLRTKKKKIKLSAINGQSG